MPTEQEAVGFISRMALWSCPGLWCMLSTFSPFRSYALPHCSQNLARHLRGSKCSILKLTWTEYVRLAPLEDVGPQGQRWWRVGLHPFCFFLPRLPISLIPAPCSLCSWPGLTIADSYNGATAWRVLRSMLEGEGRKRTPGSLFLGLYLQWLPASCLSSPTPTPSLKFLVPSAAPSQLPPPPRSQPWSYALIPSNT